MAARVVAVARSPRHGFSKDVELAITLVAGLGVEGDAHSGATVKHRSRARVDPAQPNLRQVHLIHQELIDELRARGFDVAPGAMGENITTVGLDLLALPAGTRLQLGPDALIQITGLRNPCVQLDRHRTGLMQAVLERAPDGALIRKAGVMAIVLAGGLVTAGDLIDVQRPAPPHEALRPV